MTDQARRISFGPVPSRRLGLSLGINNIPHKACSYSCIYCQIGRTRGRQMARAGFFHLDEIVRDVEKRLEHAERENESIDYLTFVADGEPTLDENLGREIDALKSLGLKIAVITNASLLWRPDLRDELLRADWVSVKIDAVSDDIWQKINRPHRRLSLEAMLKGSSDFASSFDGTLVTETMLVDQLNDSSVEFNRIAEFIGGIHPSTSYLAIPIRPPAEKWVKKPSVDTLTRAYAVFDGWSLDVEYLSGYEGNAFAYTGNIEENLLSITSVHPMREDAVRELLQKAGSTFETVDQLVRDGELIESQYENITYYTRNFH